MIRPVAPCRKPTVLACHGADKREQTMHLKPSDLDRTALYQLVIGTVVPRPIAWVTSISAAGVVNLAPFSYFTVVSVNPFTLLFCPQRQPDGSAKDTLANVQAVPEFVVHLPDQATLDAMNLSSWSFPPEVSELDQAGLTARDCDTVRVPRVAEAPVAFECRLRQIVNVGDGPGGGAAVLGDVQTIHLRDGLLDPESGRVEPDALEAIGRLGGDWYTRVTDRFELPRYRPGSADRGGR